MNPLAAYFDGLRAAAAGRPPAPAGVTGDALLSWLDGYAEGLADPDIDRSAGCPACAGDGCHVCIRAAA